MTLPLSIRDLQVRAKGRVLLSVPKLDLPAGSLTAIRGPSGAGKTTLLHALAGLTPATGRLDWGETDLTGLSQARRTRFRGQHIGMIFQDFLLFEELSARDNAIVAAAFRPDRAALGPRVDALMARLGVADLAARRADLLSGGERQRIAVVRALAHDPAILLADEPTGNLDPETSDRVFGVLMDLVRETGLSALIATHNLDLAARMDRVVRLDPGRVVTA